MANSWSRCHNFGTIKHDCNDKKQKCGSIQIFELIFDGVNSMLTCYLEAANRVIKEDWGGLMDIMPTMSKALLVLVILSIAINSVSIFKRSN